MKECCEEGCHKKHYAKGKCKGHYSSQYRESKVDQRMGKCKCGCGRITAKKKGRRLTYFSTECYPSSKRTGDIPLSGSRKQCLCGCGRWFEDQTPQLQRKFFNKGCGIIYRSQVRAKKGLDEQPKNTDSFRATICRGFNLDGSGVSYGLCENHPSCLDRVIMKEAWEYQSNGGVNCYHV